MASEIRTRQLPGRQEALRVALGKPATPLMKHIAGLDKEPRRQPPKPAPETFAFSSGIESTPAHERAALPF